MFIRRTHTNNSATSDIAQGQKVLSEDDREIRLYCYSQARGQKEEAMAKRFCELFEAALGANAEGLSRPRTEKRLTKLWERIGRLKEKSHGIGQHYHIELQPDYTKPKSCSLLSEGKRMTTVSIPLV